MSHDLPAARLGALASALRGDLPLDGTIPAGTLTATASDAVRRAEEEEQAAGLLMTTIGAATPVDVPILLSGGLDSSVLLALASRTSAGGGEPRSAPGSQRGRPPTVAVVLEDPWVDREEAAWAAVMIGRVGAVRLEICLTAEVLLRGWTEAVRAVGLPLYNARAVSRVLLLRELGRLGVCRVVSGLGADEVFAGGHAPAPSPSEQAWADTIAGPAPVVPRGRLVHGVCVEQLPLDRAGRRWGVEVVHPYLSPGVRALAALLQDRPGGPSKQALRRLAPVPTGLRRRQKRPVMATVGEAAWIEALAPWVDHAPLLDAWRAGDVGAERVAWRLACWRLLQDAVSTPASGPEEVPCAASRG